MIDLSLLQKKTFHCMSLFFHSGVSSIFFIGVIMTSIYPLPNSLSAQPITANVIGAKVGKKHFKGAEYRSGYELDQIDSKQDGKFTDRVDLFYNPFDDIQFRAFFNRVTPPTGDWKWTSIFIEPAFQLFNQKKHGFDGVLLTGLTIGLGEEAAHQGRVIFAGEVPSGSWRFRHNSIIAHQFGDYAKDGIRYEARFRVSYQVNSFFKPGFETFHQVLDVANPQSFDDQMHRGGVVVEGKLTKRLGFQTGVLSALSTKAPDWAIKVWLNYAW